MTTPKQPETDWLDELGELVEDGQLHFYTRLTLLLISKGYTPADFLAPAFDQTMALITWRPFEKQFMRSFKRFIAPLQAKQSGTFLQETGQTVSRLTQADLQQVLDHDQVRVTFSLTLADLEADYQAN
ncbi:hypothetical protein ACRYI5_02715 [Furfurilactobacillus sp. WILCCON 0119]|uniref:hypothetical protein n=1 Tax=Furfurilactobacillus entadae TaxID=2922307 RepID=UPI0035EC8491